MERRSTDAQMDSFDAARSGGDAAASLLFLSISFYAVSIVKTTDPAVYFRLSHGRL